MANQKNSFVSMLEQVAKLNKNSVEIITSLNNVTSSKKDSVTISLLNDDGTTSEYSMPTIGKLKNDVEAANANIKRLSGFEGKSYIKDGTSIKRIYTVDLSREPQEIPSINQVNEFSNKVNWFFEELMNPMLTVNVDLTGKISDNINKILSRRYIVRFTRNADNSLTTEGQNSLTNFTNTFLNGRTDITITEFLNWHTNEANNGGVVNYRDPSFNLDEQIFDINYKELPYKGIFRVLQIETDDINNKLWYHLNTLSYSDRRANGNKSLQIGDSLIIKKKSETTSRYKIVEISNANSQNKVRLERVEGYDPIGIDTELEYYSRFTSNKTINVSIGYDEYNVLFIKPINTENNVIGSLWSNGTAFYTNNLVLDGNQNNKDLATYYAEVVEDYGALLKDMVRRNIPAVRGVTPISPTLESESFNVVQINKHLTDSANAKELQQLHAEKDSIKSQLSAQQETIKSLNKKIAKEKSNSKKQEFQEKLEKAVNKQEELSNSLASITEQITNSRATQALTEEPKYRVRGFFDIPAPTSNQEVIQFKIQYKYSSKDGSTNSNETFETEDIVATFSNWEQTITDIRQRIYNVNTDTWEWLDEDVTSSDVPNINSVDIPIRQGEQVTMRIKSISEAGFPDTKIESPWSDEITIPFPDDLNNRFNEFIYEEGIKDEALVEMDNKLNTAGVYEHVRNQVSIGDELYTHKDNQILTSFTSLGNSVDLFTYLQNLTERIVTIENELAKTKGRLDVKLVFDGEETILSANSVLTIPIECTEIATPYGGGNKYVNDIYKYQKYSIWVENDSPSNSLFLLSDRSYATGGTNIYYQEPTNKMLFVDEDNYLYEQVNNQFVWFSDNHGGDPLYTGMTSSILMTSKTKELLANTGGTNLGNNDVDEKPSGTIGGFSLINETYILWTDSGNTDLTGGTFLATVHPELTDPIELQELAESGEREIKPENKQVIKINIYFKLSDVNYEEPADEGVYTWRARRDYSDVKILDRYVKLYMEKVGEQRPLQYTLRFRLKRNEPATRVR